MTDDDEQRYVDAARRWHAADQRVKAASAERAQARRDMQDAARGPARRPGRDRWRRRMERCRIA